MQDSLVLLNQHFLALIVTALTAGSLAFFIYIKGKNGLTSNLYALYTAAIAYWALTQAFAMTETDHDLSLLLWRLNYVGVIFIPIFFVHFVVSLMSREEQASKARMIRVSYVVGLVFQVINLFGLVVQDVVPKYYFPHYKDASPVYYVMFTIWVAWTTYAMVLICMLYRNTHGNRRRIIGYFVMAMTGAYIGGVPNFLPVFDIFVAGLIPYGTYAVPIYITMIAYAIVTELVSKKDHLELELERSERLKSVGTLAAGMAHEIKNPMTTIKTFMKHLPEKFDDREYRDKFLRLVGGEVDRVLKITNELLQFAKKEDPVKEEVDMNVLLKNTTELLSNDIFQFKITLLQNYHTPCPKVLCDPNQIKQVFLNILMNSIQSMEKDGGVLHVRTMCSGSSVSVRIGDQGIGMDREQQIHMFDPFYTNKTEGTGLGMAIARGLTERNGGKIEVDSKLGQGTEFNIIFKAV